MGEGVGPRFAVVEDREFDVGVGVGGGWWRW